MGRVAAASAQRQEAKELSAAHQQKRDRVVQACSMLKVWAAVCVHVSPLLRCTDVWWPPSCVV